MNCDNAERVGIEKNRQTYNFRVWYGNKKIFDLKKNLNLGFILA